MTPDLFKHIYTDDIASIIIGWVKLGLIHEMREGKLLRDRADMAFDVVLQRVLPDSKDDRKRKKKVRA